MNKKKLISIICPVYNEANALNLFIDRIIPILNSIKYNYELIFINDGSKDETLEILLNTKKRYKNIRIINFSRNFGKEAALTAGIDKAKGDAIIAIDADLQHPPEIILKFIEKWEDGYDVVVGKRLSRTGETFLKKLSAKLFYSLHNKISDINIPADIGDFRLISRKVADAIKSLPENQRFMKGIFAWVGFNSAIVEYYQDNRIAGKSSFNGWKLWNFAIDGITSFSTTPLRIWLYIGIIISFISFLLGLILVLQAIIHGVDVPGYTSTITMVLFLGGIQLIGIGILGEYIGRIYKEAKRRPNYIIENEY